MQGQEGPADGAAHRKPAAGTVHAHADPEVNKGHRQDLISLAII